ncbi:MAG: S49 family peptidase, partial [Myxococcota bacterium]
MSTDPNTEPKTRSKGGRRTVTVVLLLLTVAVIAVFGVAFGAVVYFMQGDSTATVAEGSFLKIRLEGEITDAPVQGGLFAEPEDLPLTATEIAAAVRKAITDDRVNGVYLDVRAPAMGWGLAREIRTSLVELRESGKPCVAYGEVYTTRDYYLASACDEVIIAPSGVPVVIGQAMSITYYHDALEYLGVTPRIVHVGDFKTAVEPYERMEPSEQAKESYEFLLDGLWGTVTAEIAESRGMSTDAVMQVFDNPSLTPRRMVDSGLFTAVGYADSVESSLDSVGDAGWRDTLMTPVVSSKDERKDRFTTIKEYRKGLDDGSSDTRIAVVYAEGTIYSGEATGGLFGDSGLFDGNFRKWMRTVRDDDTIKAVVVRVNSPGGSALASDM